MLTPLNANYRPRVAVRFQFRDLAVSIFAHIAALGALHSLSQLLETDGERPSAPKPKTWILTLETIPSPPSTTPAPMKKLRSQGPKALEPKAAPPIVPIPENTPGNPQLILGYLKNLQQRIQKHLAEELDEAFARGSVAQARVKMRIGQAGEIAQLEMVESSGNQELDKKVSDTILRLAPLDRFDQAFAHLGFLTLTVPIVFK